MTIEESEPAQIEAAVLVRPQKRDALGQFCFAAHFLPLTFVVTGWLAPWRWLLAVYLIFLPSMFLQWRLNRGSCVLNNIESIVRTGRWRNPNNREEGAWLRTLVNDSTGWTLSRRQMDVFINALMLVLWLLGLGHLAEWL